MICSFLYCILTSSGFTLNPKVYGSCGIPAMFRILYENNDYCDHGSVVCKAFPVKMMPCRKSDMMLRRAKYLKMLWKGERVKYLTGVYWERGSAADINQDSLVLLQVLTAKGRVLMAAVCDGMGGLAQGEWASGYVTKRLQEWFYESLLRAVQKKKPYWVIRRSVDRLVYHMQEQIARYGGQEGIRLGTTMTVLVLWDKTYLLWHLGDSRAYWLRKDIVCMTKDHVKGINQLTKCVGSFGYERPDFKLGVLREGQGVLLCSDGFRHFAEESELADVLRPGQIQKEEQITRRLREIGDACMKRGERDNLSAVYVKVE